MCGGPSSRSVLRVGLCGDFGLSRLLLAVVRFVKGTPLPLPPPPARGYPGHGESWSGALGLKLAAYQLLRRDLGEDPVLVLDDVFAELDVERRERLADLVADYIRTLADGGKEWGTLDELADEIAIIAAPGQVSPAVQDALLSHAETRKARFAVLDSPETINGGVDQLPKPRNSKYGAY